MKILHVTDTFRPVLGGIEVLVDDLSRNQRTRGHDVTVLTTTTTTTRPDEPGVIRGAHRPGDLRATLEAMRPGVVHCHSSLVSPLAWRAARIASTLGIPVVITMHSIVPSTGVLSGVVAGLVGATLGRVSWTSVSAAAAASLQPLVPTVVHVLPNGIDVDSCLPAAPGCAPVPTVVSVMRLARRKRPLALVRVLSAMNRYGAGAPWRAVIVGDGPQAGATERHLRAAGLAEQVSLAGRLEREEVLALLSRSDLYLAPSRLEAFGLAALEARCSGLPVVAMRGGGVGEFVRDGVHGHLVGNDDEMARRAALLVADPARLRAMARACRVDRPDLDWNDTVGRSLAAYDRAGGRVARPDQAVLRMASTG